MQYFGTTSKKSGNFIIKILGLRKFEEIWKLSNMKASTEKLNRKLIGNYY